MSRVDWMEVSRGVTEAEPQPRLWFKFSLRSVLSSTGKVW